MFECTDCGHIFSIARAAQMRADTYADNPACPFCGGDSTPYRQTQPTTPPRLRVNRDYPMRKGEII
jgi:galactose-1-phosphate uridylyltransferase